ncbi:polysaccharide biosynthesis tyrosine autokinase [Rhizobium sp. CFBP 8762]|uniref:GumC family protein n=1 Tax=Rhizobium sp. CFBP 8762 TaxID=2775279 RepID=UPI00177B8E96|nr:polysaccharide biosynthesis tyrosine autokinase [Rhizobium sp. CFBP 8762]MBD8554062.1 polysaccharide biosynthesis tyrosine autokinase [Rhizobium sp. CFBP 8762]
MIWPGQTRAEDNLAYALISVLWKRRALLMAGIAAGLSVALLGYLSAPSRYRAETVLALDLRKLQAAPGDAVVSALPQESPVLRTELDIIGSRMMAERVVEQVKATDATKGRTSGITVDDLLTNVRAVNDGRSYTIYVSYTGSDPEVAALVTNTYGSAYIDYQIGLQTSATRRVSDWLGGRLATLRQTLEDSERTATAFREKSGIVKSNGTTLLAQQIAGINNEMAASRAREAGLKARLSTAQDASGATLSEVLNSATIQALRAEEARLNRALTQISESGATKNPQLPQIRSQISTLRSQIDTEVQQIVASLRNEIDVAERQQVGLQASLQQMQTDMSKATQAIVQADQLDREASANRAIYESYLTRYKQTIEQDGIATAEARIISPAMPPQKRVSPNLMAWILAGMLLGGTVGVGLALLLELRRRSKALAQRLSEKTGLAVFGQLPALNALESRDIAQAVRSSASPMGRALADLQAVLRLALPVQHTPVLAVASLRDHDGKTFVAANLARSLTAAGVSTVVIDANLRSPGVAEAFGLRPKHYIDEIVSGKSDPRAVTQRDVSGVDVICARASAAPTEFLLGDARFEGMIDDLRQHYQVILIDTPSVTDGMDAVRIATLCDGLMFVVTAGADPDEVSKAVHGLQSSGCTVTGLVLNGTSSHSLGRSRKQAGIPAQMPDWLTTAVAAGKSSVTKPIVPVPPTARTDVGS